MAKFTKQISLYRICHARNLILRTLNKLKWGSLIITYTNQEGEKETQEFGSQDDDAVAAKLIVKSDKFWQRLCTNMDIGMSEAFMLNEVECPNLVELFTIYIKNKNALGVGSPMLSIIPRLQWIFSSKSNTIAKFLQNTKSHYDTSNDLFSGFLSTDMNYSCPIWNEIDYNSPSEVETLEEAQQRKVHTIIVKANIQASDYVLDIGCGWGNLAIEAVRLTGCRVRGVTLSAAQKQLAEENIKKAGFGDRIDISLCDYRQIPSLSGGYDKIVSVEMIEHVGKGHMNTFFERITRLLKPNVGQLVVQGITVTNERHGSKANIDTFIDRYIFPGGYLPTTQIILNAIHNGSKGELEIRDVQSIGPHYVRALRLWREEFLENWESKIKPSFICKEQRKLNNSLTSLEPVRKKWEYYFSYCEAGFEQIC